MADMSGREDIPASLTLGEAMGAVRWDYDPRQRLLSPLVAASLYFADFPWDGEENGEEEDEFPPPLVPPGPGRA